MAKADVEDEIQALGQLEIKTLRIRWQKLYQAPTPKSLSRDLLTRMITYKLREQVYGGLKPAARRQLKELVAQLERKGRSSFDVTPSLSAGTRLLREWRQSTYVVLVKREGFEFQERHYDSLSVIAREITGARWSGPRFFGLVKPSKPKGTQGEVAHG